MRITKNFTMEELTHSDTAIELGIFNNPSAKEQEALVNLTTKLLQPLRDAIGRAIYINSGYRSEAANRAVGGVRTSQHCKGEAADIRINGDARQLLDMLRETGLPFDQAILYRKQNFLHVSLKLEGEQRKMILYKP